MTTVQTANSKWPPDPLPKRLDYDHHTLWNVVCEASVLIYHSAMGNENSAEHETACIDFLERLRSHPDTKRLQREILKENECGSSPALSKGDL